MRLTIRLTPTEEQRLHELAAQRGVAVEELARKAVTDLLLPATVEEKLARLHTLLEEEDEEEQRETGAYLRRVLDEDRLSYRKLFP
jgi:hypothetical protein